jgi:hypothetical protein
MSPEPSFSKSWRQIARSSRWAPTPHSGVRRALLGMHWLHGFPYRQAIHLRSGRNGVVFDQHLTAICDLLDVGRDMQAIVAKLVQLHAVLVVHHADRLAWNESQASNVGGRRRRGLDLHPRLSHGGASRAHAEQEQGAAAVLRAQGPDRAMVSRCG